MPKIVFDIETIGVDYDSLDETTQKSLSGWIERETQDEKDYERMMRAMKEGLGFSPLTGEIVAIGLLNPETNKGAVYFQAPGKEIKPFEEEGVKFESSSESEILQKFWSDTARYDEFISFNGRAFDVPFLMIRSAIHKIRPTKDLMSNRYLTSQKFASRHIDLLDQLTFYGAVRRKGNIHLWCRAFDIKSPKADGVTGHDVAELFKREDYEKIARYNVGDLRATKDLYEYWEKYIRF